MPTFLVQKLVRDNLDPEGIWQGLRHLKEDEFFKELKIKLCEESAEVLESKSKEDLVDELADVIDIIETIKSLKSISDSDILAAQEKKMARRGRYEKRQYAESVSFEENHRLTHHCRSQPAKYKEVL